MTDPIRMTKVTLEIDGGRKLYNYTFEIDEDQELAPPRAEKEAEPETNE